MELELLSLFIPFIAIIIMAIFFSNKVVWWEYVMLIGVPLIFILLLHKIFIVSLTGDTKYLDTYIVKVEYYEEWNEYIHRTCYRTVKCGKDCTTQVPYDCSYVQYHSENYIMIDNLNNGFGISEKKYKSLITQFSANPIFKDLNRNYHTKDGDMYYFHYNNDPKKLEPTTIFMGYTNKTQASKNLFKFEDITDEEALELGLYDYPKIINNYQKSVLGKTITPQEENLINQINSFNGSRINVKVFILYFKNKPIETAFKQESYWDGGNNNEFVICISEDNNGNLQWVKTFSWMDTPTLEKNFETQFRSKDRIYITEIYNYLTKNITKDWVYNDFKKFDYIQIHVTDGQLIWIYIIVMILTVGIGYWVYHNEFEHYDNNRKVKTYNDLKKEYKNYRKFKY